MALSTPATEKCSSGSVFRLGGRFHLFLGTRFR